MRRELSFYQELVVRKADAPLDQDLVRRKLDAVQAAGIHNIGHDGIGGLEIDKNMQAFIDFVAKELERRQMRVTSFHYAGCTYSQDAGENARILEGMRRTVEGFGAWKPRAFVVHAGWLPGSGNNGVLAEGRRLENLLGREGLMERIAENLRAFAEMAKPWGISLALENVAPMLCLGSMEDQLEIVRRIGMENVGVCLDAGHAHLDGQNVAEYVRMAGKNLVETHFHDNVGPAGMPGRHPDLHWPVGLGTVNWPGVIDALDDIGYNGPVTFETTGFPLETPAEGYRASVQFWRMLEDKAR